MSTGLSARPNVPIAASRTSGVASPTTRSPTDSKGDRAPGTTCPANSPAAAAAAAANGPADSALTLSRPGQDVAGLTAGCHGPYVQGCPKRAAKLSAAGPGRQIEWHGH